MRKKIVAANWKMNMSLYETENFWKVFDSEIPDSPSVEIVIAPPFTALQKLSELTAHSQKIRIGAQNMHPEKSGAFTGEISASMLRELFVRYVILGHSERRLLLGESNEFINKKVLAALASQLRVILCVGETLPEREAGREKQVVEAQLRSCLKDVKPEQFEDIVIAYEPVWAIGTGRNASPQQAQECHAAVRSILAELASPEFAQRVRIQYGGSVNPSNAPSLLEQPDIDGALVGGASLDPRNFALIVRAAEEKQTTA